MNVKPRTIGDSTVLSIALKLQVEGDSRHSVSVCPWAVSVSRTLMLVCDDVVF